MITNNKENWIKILDIARNVRISAQIHEDSCIDLNGWCAICSYHIFKKLRKLGKKPYFVIVADGHCFVLLKGKAIDVTATQFNEKEQVIVDKLENLQGPYKWYWSKESMKKITTIKEIKKELEGWPKEQNPFYVNFVC
jgi:hypothetical protein